jgi:hypothetical protein
MKAGNRHDVMSAKFGRLRGQMQTIPLVTRVVIRFPAAGRPSWSGAVVEGCGVQPDVDVPLSTGALRNGNDNHLQLRSPKRRQCDAGGLSACRRGELWGSAIQSA